MSIAKLIIPTCDDIDSLVPECSNCRTFCNMFSKCTGFMVRLEILSRGHGGQRGQCLLMEGNITVQIKNVSPVLCYERGMKSYHCNLSILIFIVFKLQHTD